MKDLLQTILEAHRDLFQPDKAHRGKEKFVLSFTGVDYPLTIIFDYDSAKQEEDGGGFLYIPFQIRAEAVGIGDLIVAKGVCNEYLEAERVEVTEPEELISIILMAATSMVDGERL